MIPITIIVVLAGAYALFGMVVGTAYLLRAAPQQDEALRASSSHVRLLLLPGSIVVWPLLLSRFKNRPEVGE